MDLRTMLLAIRLLRIGGHILFPDRGLPGRVRYMRWIVVDHARRAIDNIHFNVNKQLIFFNWHDDDDFGHHQHELYEQQCQCKPNGHSPAGSKHHHRRHVRKQQVLYWMGVWTMLFTVGLLWVVGYLLFTHFVVSAQLRDM